MGQSPVFSFPASPYKLFVVYMVVGMTIIIRTSQHESLFCSYGLVNDSVGSEEICRVPPVEDCGSSSRSGAWLTELYHSNRVPAERLDTYVMNLAWVELDDDDSEQISEIRCRRDEYMPIDCRIHRDLCNVTRTISTTIGNISWPKTDVGARRYVVCPYAYPEEARYASFDCLVNKLANNTPTWFSYSDLECPMPIFHREIEELYNNLTTSVIEISNDSCIDLLKSLEQLVKTRQLHPTDPIFLVDHQRLVRISLLWTSGCGANNLGLNGHETILWDICDIVFDADKCYNFWSNMADYLRLIWYLSYLFPDSGTFQMRGSNLYGFSRKDFPGNSFSSSLLTGPSTSALVRILEDQNTSPRHVEFLLVKDFMLSNQLSIIGLIPPGLTDPPGYTYFQGATGPPPLGSTGWPGRGDISGGGDSRRRRRQINLYDRPLGKLSTTNKIFTFSSYGARMEDVIPPQTSQFSTGKMPTSNPSGTVEARAESDTSPVVRSASVDPRGAHPVGPGGVLFSTNWKLQSTLSDPAWFGREAVGPSGVENTLKLEPVSSTTITTTTTTFRPTGFMTNPKRKAIGPLIFVDLPETQNDQGYQRNVTSLSTVFYVTVRHPDFKKAKSSKMGIVTTNRADFRWNQWYTSDCILLQHINDMVEFTCGQPGFYVIFNKTDDVGIGATTSGGPAMPTTLATTTSISDLAVFLGFEYNYELYLAGLVLRAVSLICLVVTVLSYIIFKKARRGIPTEILLHLCVTLILLNAVLYVAEVKADTRLGCKVSNVFRYYLVLVSLLWNAIEAYNMYRMLIKVFSSGDDSYFVAKSALVAWGLPAAAVGIAFAVDATAFDGTYYQCIFRCSLRERMLYYGWIIPMGIIMIHNLIIFGLVMNVLCKRKSIQSTDTRSKSLWTSLCGALTMLVLLGVPWMFSAFGVIDAGDNKSLSALEGVFNGVFTVCISVQGLFIFWFHCARVAAMREQWKSSLTTRSRISSFFKSISSNSRMDSGKKSTPNAKNGTKIDNIQNTKKATLDRIKPSFVKKSGDNVRKETKDAPLTSPHYDAGDGDDTSNESIDVPPSHPIEDILNDLKEEGEVKNSHWDRNSLNNSLSTAESDYTFSQRIIKRAVLK